MNTRRLPIRLRLTLWYLASFFVVLLLFGAGAFYAMRTSIQRDFDRDLQIRLTGLQSFLDSQAHNKWQRVQHELWENATLRPGGELLQISDEEGHWLFQTDAMRYLKIEMPAHHLPAAPIFATISAGGVPVRLVTASKAVNGRRYGIQLAQSLTESTKLVQNFGLIFMGAIPIVLLVAGATGYWMARRALQPVMAITRDAQAISALDISKRITILPAHDELRTLSTTLNEMMDRLEAAFQRITRFTADASHELRTPIALIRTTAELALAEHSPRTSFEALESILEESERTTNLLEDLLLLARADSHVRPRFETIDLHTPTRQAVTQAGLLAASKNIALDFRPSQEPCFLHGNAELLRRLFLILTENAVKYTAAGGHVLVRLYRDNGKICVEAQDTGAGISAEDLPHIFERFYRADKARDRSGGAGLGLSIADWITKAHHGTIRVSSVVDQGTTFTVQFPGIDAVHHTAALPESTIEQMQGYKNKV